VIMLPAARAYRQQYHPPAQPRRERDILLVDNFARAQPHRPKVPFFSTLGRRRNTPTTWTSADSARPQSGDFETAKSPRHPAPGRLFERA